MKHIEAFLEWGGLKKDIFCLSVSAVALIISIFGLVPLPFDAAWAAIVLCGIPIILEAVVGLVTAFDIKADVLVSIALIASLIIGEDFAAGEVAFIMQLGALLEDLTVAKARAGIEKLVHLTPQTARRLRDGGEPIGYVHVSGGESRDLGYAVRRDCRNRGFATEACEAVLARLRRDGAPFVTATHDVRNPASGAVMEKLGMTYRYTYRELWQPKNRIVVFRMYQYNFDGSDREYAGYRARYGAWREPTGADGRIGGERARK